MNENKKIFFYNNTAKKPLDFSELIKEISLYVREKPEAEYRITIGTDSPGITRPRFITAVSILRVGNGGRYFWTKSQEYYCPSLQERIYKEVMQSVTLTQELRSKLKDELGEDTFWDNQITIHIDVGRNGSTKDLVEGVVGMVKGYGFMAAIKPDSFCASVVADRHT